MKRQLTSYNPIQPHLCSNFWPLLYALTACCVLSCFSFFLSFCPALFCEVEKQQWRKTAAWPRAAQTKWEDWVYKFCTPVDYRCADNYQKSLIYFLNALPERQANINKKQNRNTADVEEPAGFSRIWWEKKITMKSCKKTDQLVTLDS